MSQRFIARGIVAAVLTGAMSIAGSGIAHANETDQHPKTDRGADQPAENRVHQVDKTAKTVTNVDSQAGTLTIAVPGELTDARPVDVSTVPAGLFKGSGEPLMSTRLHDASVSTYATETGSHSLITIESPAAAQDYRFPLEIPSGATASVTPDGAVTIKNEHNEVLGGFRVPWAFDANGNPVTTSYTIDGTDLVQTIGHGPGTAYPVVADPNDFWGWVACGLEISGAIVGNTVLASRILKLGGVARFIDKLKHAKNFGDHGRLLGALIGDISGINGILERCR